MRVDLINFSQHALSEDVLGDVAAATGAGEVVEHPVAVEIDNDVAIVDQITAVCDGLPWSNEGLQHLNLVVVLPGLSAAAATLLAEFHGRVGYFPTIARLRRADGPVVVFELAELVPLQGVREAARKRR